jgi:anti-sigma regulatory factor (Ser/Thr protein kinase)
MTQLLSVSLPIDPDAPSAARFLIGTISDRLPDVPLEQIALLSHELVMNSVRHSGAGPQDSVGFEVYRNGEDVVVEVADGGPGFSTAPRERSPDAQGGLGLQLVDRLATRWGVTREAGRTRAWFQLSASYC